MQLLSLLDDYENEKALFEYLQTDLQNVIDFLRFVVDTPISPKYPFIVSELLYGSYDQLLSLLFSWNGEPIKYLLEFSLKNETSCGYFEKCIRPLLLLKTTDILPYLDTKKWLSLIDQESIQNIYTTILDCSLYEEQFKQELISNFFEYLNESNSPHIFRILVKEQEQFQKYILQNPNTIDIIYKCTQSIEQLCLVEQLIEWNQENLPWLHAQLQHLQTLEIQQQQKSQEMNFLLNPVLGEINLKIIKILTLTLPRPETIHFQELLLKLLIQFEWNNALQIIAVNMYQEMANNDSPHKQYFTNIISQFIKENVSFELHDFGLKKPVARGYRWVFTKIVQLFQLDFPLAQEINTTEKTFLLNEDPSNNRERQSFNILEKASERRLLWFKRVQEEEPQQDEGSQQIMEQEPEQVYQGRNSFGIRPPPKIEEEEEECCFQQGRGSVRPNIDQYL